MREREGEEKVFFSNRLCCHVSVACKKKKEHSQKLKKEGGKGRFVRTREVESKKKIPKTERFTCSVLLIILDFLKSFWYRIYHPC